MILYAKVKKAAPALRVMALAIEVAAAVGGIRAPVGQALDAFIGNKDFLTILNDISPDPIFDALADSKDLEAIQKHIDDNKSSRREAFLAIRDILGDRNVLATCGLTKEIKGDGNVVWILNNEIVVDAFRQGKSRDEAKQLLSAWDASQKAAAAPVAKQEAKKQNWIPRFR